MMTIVNTALQSQYTETPSAGRAQGLDKSKRARGNRGGSYKSMSNTEGHKKGVYSALMKFLTTRKGPARRGDINTQSADGRSQTTATSPANPTQRTAAGHDTAQSDLERCAGAPAMWASKPASVMQEAQPSG